MPPPVPGRPPAPADTDPAGGGRPPPPPQSRVKGSEGEGLPGRPRPWKAGRGPSPRSPGRASREHRGGRGGRSAPPAPRAHTLPCTRTTRVPARGSPLPQPSPSPSHPRRPESGRGCAARRLSPAGGLWALRVGGLGRSLAATGVSLPTSLGERRPFPSPPRVCPPRQAGVAPGVPRGGAAEPSRQHRPVPALENPGVAKFPRASSAPPPPQRIWCPRPRASPCAPRPVACCLPPPEASGARAEREEGAPAGLCQANQSGLCGGAGWDGALGVGVSQQPRAGETLGRRLSGVSSQQEAWGRQHSRRPCATAPQGPPPKACVLWAGELDPQPAASGTPAPCEDSPGGASLPHLSPQQAIWA